VFDVPAVLASRVRLMGSGRSQKNDPNDARSIAIWSALGLLETVSIGFQPAA
jgi:hypothetical protein